MDIVIRELNPSLEADRARVEQARPLYERSFPPQERRDFDGMVRECGDDDHLHLLVATEGEHVLGLSIFRYVEEASLGYLWYLCVAHSTRGKGVGASLYRRTLDILRDDARRSRGGLKGLIFEVDPLNTEPTPDFGDPVKRIRFYERLGARLVLGYDYVQPPIPPYGPVPLELMFHPLMDDESLHGGPALARVIEDFMRCLKDGGNGVPETVALRQV